MSTNNMNNNTNKSEILHAINVKDFIIAKLKEWMTPKMVIKELEDNKYNTEHISNLYKYVDNLKQRNKDKILLESIQETQEVNNSESNSLELEELVYSTFEDLRLKWIIWNKAILSIKQRVKDELDQTLENWEIIELLKRVRWQREQNEETQSVIQELNENIEDIKKYSVEDNHYIFHIKKQNWYWEDTFLEVRLPVSLVDWLFYDFSKFGSNMSSTQILQKYRLKPEVFQALKSRLGLYKASNVISPYTLENSNNEELDDKITHSVSSSIQDKYKEKFVRTYDKVFEQQAKKAFKTAGNIEDVIELVRDWIQDMEPLLVDRRAINTEIHNSDIAIFVSSDYHFGEQDDPLLEARLDELVNEMCLSREHNINWISLGDYAETFLEEGMHAWQTNRMRLHGFELVQYIYKVFASRMLKIVESGKHLTIDWQGGNHDRMGKTNDMDRARTWALVIGEMIELSLKNYIDQGLVTFNNYTSPTIRRKIWKLWIIANHWDWMWHKMTNDAILAKFGFWSDTYHIILEGDKHHFIANQGNNSIKVVTSSVKSGWQFAEEVIYKDNVPWFLKITETKTGKARIGMNMFDN